MWLAGSLAGKIHNTSYTLLDLLISLRSGIAALLIISFAQIASHSLHEVALFGRVILAATSFTCHLQPGQAQQTGESVNAHVMIR